MIRIDSPLESSAIAGLRAGMPGMALWICALLLAVCLWTAAGGLQAAWAQNAPPAEQQQTGGQSAEPMTDIHDIKPALPMGTELGWLIWLAIALVVIGILAAAAWWLWRRRRKSVEETRAAPLPAPEVEAYALLDGLAAEDHGNLKRFYFRLSAILRRYMERRYGFPAAEMTTEELLPAMRGLDLPLDLGREVKSFCFRSDLIKFAGAGGDAGRVAHELAFVRDFVRQTTKPSNDVDAGMQAEMKADEMPNPLPAAKQLE